MKTMNQTLSVTLLLVLATQASAQFPTDTVYDKPLHVRVGNDVHYVYPLDTDKIVSETLMIPVEDNGSGTTELAANVWYPTGGGAFPVIMSLTTYDKDLTADRYITAGRSDAFHGAGLSIGDFTISNAVSFEAADPGFFVPHGYAVMVVDGPGTGSSPGIQDPFGKATLDAFKQAVEWVARGSTGGGPAWSNGKVSTQGTSYLGIIQWLTGSTQPEGLDAMSVWQGLTDHYRDSFFAGGIFETGLTPFWLANKHGAFPDVDTAPTYGMTFNKTPYELIDEKTNYEIPRVSNIEQIEVPVLVAANWAAQGVHLRGSIEGYRRLDVENVGRVPRYLYTHGREEWTVMTSDEGLGVQLEFFDCHLKDVQSACAALNEKPVRIEVMHGDNMFHDRVSDQWPVADTEYRKLYLDVPSMDLSEEMPERGLTQYVSDIDPHEDGEVPNPLVVFRHTFEKDTEVIGHPRLRLIASPWLFDPRARDENPETNVDMDVFVGLRKVDADGNVKRFSGTMVGDTLFTRGWLRASLRKTTDTINGYPVPDYLSPLAFDEVQHLQPGHAYQLDIEILPMGIFFEKGSTLELIISGHAITSSPNHQKKQLVNVGTHSIFTGGSHPGKMEIEASYLELPVVELGRAPTPVSKDEPLPLPRTPLFD